MKKTLESHSKGNCSKAQPVTMETPNGRWSVSLCQTCGKYFTITRNPDPIRRISLETPGLRMMRSLEGEIE